MLASHLSLLEDTGLIRRADNGRAQAPDADPEFLFRHVMVEEVAYQSLLKHQRRRLHLAVGEVLEELYQDHLDELAPVLAQHYYEAGELRRARRFFARAAEKAAEKFANLEAANHYTRAIDITGGDMVPNPELYRARAQVRERLGALEAAQADLDTALALAQANHDQRAEWQILLDLALLWAGRDYTRSGDYCRRALDLAQRMNEPDLLAHSLNRLGNWHLNLEEPRDALHYHETALAIFEGRQDMPGIAETVDLMGMTSFLAGNLAQAAAYFQQAIELHRHAGNRPGLATCLASLSMCAGSYYHVKTMRPGIDARQDWSGAVEEALQISRDIGWRSGEAFALFLLACYLGPRGDYARTVPAAQAALALAGDIGHRQWTAASHHAVGSLLLDVLRPEEAVDHLKRGLGIAFEIDSQFWVRVNMGQLALAHLACGDISKASVLLETASDVPDVPQTTASRLIVLARAELALAHSKPARALTLADHLLATAGDPPAGLDVQAVPAVTHLRARALAALGRGAEAEAEWQAALYAAETYGERCVTWRLHRDLGRHYAAQGQAEAAASHFEQARAIVAALAPGLPEAWQRDYCRRALD